MKGVNRSKLVRITVRNIGCIGEDGVAIALDNVVCLVGKNNAGKSTILRAYELAKGSVQFDENKDRCLRAPSDKPSEVPLEVHIPDGIGNVDSRWKEAKDGLLIVKSRWQWAPGKFQKIRTTWDPSGGADGNGAWAEDGKAGGADPVFNSRLPRPLRIGSLDDAAKTEEMLLTLALGPLLAGLEKERIDPASALSMALAGVTTRVKSLSGLHEEHFNGISGRVAKGFKRVFPRLDVKLNVAASPIVPKLAELLKSGSSLKVQDGKTQTSLHQQGTGARRALFWSMLQVHNEFSRYTEVRQDYRRRLEKDLEVAKGKLKKESDKGAGKSKEADLQHYDKLVAELTSRLKAHDEDGSIPDSEDDPAFPGYLLLIDEPENALHPMAARAAQRHLYELAKLPDWQVIMTTHSPHFVNPFEDHTTIVRLERESEDDDAPMAPKTYRSDEIEFEFQEDDKQRLQALQHIDPSFSEVFFGSYPVLVEGDTEHAAFMSSIIERGHGLMDEVTVIRARGKAILVPLIKVMTHFKIDFGIVHDVDPPYKLNGHRNGMWTENGKIREAVLKAREAGLNVRHRISVPDFERFLGGQEESKDKPLNTYLTVAKDDAMALRVQTLMTDLRGSDQHEPFPDGALSVGDYLTWLSTQIKDWAEANGQGNYIRFKGPAASATAKAETPAASSAADSALPGGSD
ncbi:ATP-dependent nuclease [Paracidovorax cattleyae]|uniref:AAA domain-containing protein, putative AbiEii toxin, Type IV TA system n=1 Tax=Paracidovorax cattleyae TaxID=80868 RepID=A0A1H0MB88_9BURK|nr:AAA family ATPase [Paracidovorax cattleyae]SDO77647.1 AAA domain-containing protein, putative AbiEii toxin, Type IV TA system [Paracidovorax cattleyae]